MQKLKSDKPLVPNIRHIFGQKSNLVCSMASESIIDTAQSMSHAVDLARKVIVQKENFKKFSTLLERTTLVLQELSTFEVKNSDLVNKALENLQVEIKIARQLASECSKGNKVYLLLSCKRIVENLDTSSKNINQALGSLEISLGTNERLIKLRKDMEDAQYQVSVMEEEILHKIETGLQDRNTDRSYATDLLIRISESVGISSEQSELKKEFEDFRNEMQRIESRTEASRMEQIFLLLGNADIVTTPEEKEMKYLIKRDSLGRDLSEPLPSFYCPITADIMVDPVETATGHTYERGAIEKWLKEGNNLCPMTKTPLSRLSLRPNRTLRQSIEEWRNRNIMITIASMKPELKSGEEQEVLHSLRKLHDLCKTSELHREWIVMEDYISIITGFLSAKNSDIRMHALNILYRLAKDGDDNKVSSLLTLTQSNSCKGTEGRIIYVLITSQLVCLRRTLLM